MITGADVKSGYGQKREKGFNSILPYLRAKQAEEEAGKKPASPKPVRKTEKAKEPEYTPNTEETYNEARREILAEE